MSYIPGAPLSSIYDKLSFEQRRPYLVQLARYFVQMQNIKFVAPEGRTLSIGCFGGIRPNGDAFEVDIVPNAYNARGPYKDHYDYQIDFIKCHLDDMKTTQGGRFNKYVPCFEQYIKKLELESKLEQKQERLVLAHLDIAPKNIMVDLETSTITGIIDWEWATLSNFDEDWRRFTEPFSNIEEDVWHSENEREQAICKRGLWRGEKERKFLMDEITRVYEIPDAELYDKRKDNWYVARYALNLVLYHDWFVDKDALLEYEKRLESKVKAAFQRHDITLEE
jgi:hypothetical protein